MKYPKVIITPVINIHSWETKTKTKMKLKPKREQMF